MICIITTKKGRPCKNVARYGFVGDEMFCHAHSKFMAVPK